MPTVIRNFINGRINFYRTGLLDKEWIRSGSPSMALTKNDWASGQSRDLRAGVLTRSAEYRLGVCDPATGEPSGYVAVPGSQGVQRI